MNLVTNFRIYLLINLVASFYFLGVYTILKGFLSTYNLMYGIIILVLAVSGILRIILTGDEGTKIRGGIQASWLIVSIGIGYISLIYAPVLKASIDILIEESILSLIQVVYGAFLLTYSYKKGYSIIKV